MLCDGVCTDILTDSNNCGACGEACTSALALNCCDGGCVNLLNSELHCGTCGTPCRAPGTCNFGACSCPPGSAYCDGDCVEVREDPANCGGCGVVCPEGAPCEWGACVCPEGQSFCDDACRPTDECLVAVFGEPQVGDPSGSSPWTGGDVCPGTELFTSTATYYELGNALPHCSYPPESLEGMYYAAINEEDYAAAATCGACVRVYYGGLSVDLQIVDECSYAGNPQWCYPGSHHIDLSRDAFAYLEDPAVGVLDVQWQYVECNVEGGLKYAFKDGSSTYWTALMIRNHPLALASVEYQNISGTFRPLTRVNYNYWLDDRGFGIGPYTFRITDIAGNTVTEAGIPTIEGEVATVEFYDMEAQLPGCE